MLQQVSLASSVTNANIVTAAVFAAVTILIFSGNPPLPVASLPEPLLPFRKNRSVPERLGLGELGLGLVTVPEITIPK